MLVSFFNSFFEIFVFILKFLDELSLDSKKVIKNNV